MPKTPFIKTDFVPAMYDVADQKLVAIFCNNTTCAKYIHTDSGHKKFNLHYIAISDYILHKRRCCKNHFNRTVCFRNATAAQKDMLGQQEFLILDERYVRPEITTLQTAGFHSTRAQMAHEHARSAYERKHTAKRRKRI